MRTPFAAATSVSSWTRFIAALAMSIVNKGGSRPQWRRFPPQRRMKMRRFKDLWQEYYEDAIEKGYSDDAAGELAHYLTTDYYAEQADNIKDRLKDEGKWPPK